MKLLLEHKPERLPLSLACQHLDLNRSSLYARRAAARAAPASDRQQAPRAPQPRALSPAEREQVVGTLNSEEFQDQPPLQVYMQLLERGQYLCSVSTMYRLLRAQGQSGERRQQRPAQPQAMPRLAATAPNQVWTWDITKLALTQKGVYLSLCVIIDLFSRYALAWMLSRKENSALSHQLMREAMGRYPHAATALTIHQDRGSPMIARNFLEVISDLGATASHSRPRVSNDNPFSESQFKTLKYQPDYPGRFEHYAHAERWCQDYFEWYNFEHHHSALAGFTPAQVFTQRYQELAVQRAQVMNAAFEEHPERFVGGRPRIKLPPQVVAINPLYREDGSIETETGVNFPTLTRAKEAAKLH